MGYMMFNGRNTFDEFGLYVTQHTTFLPPQRKKQMVVDGRDGAVDQGLQNIFDPRILMVECMLVNVQNVQPVMRELAYALSRRGRIVFSDEPELAYIGRSFDAVDLARLDYKARRFDISFECHPFLAGKTLTKDGEWTVGIKYVATARTPCRISIENTGTEPISGITITHKIIER